MATSTWASRFGVARPLAIALSYNFNLHTEHHLFPTVPWYSLPKVTEKVKNMEECTYNEVGMVSFAADLRSQDPIDLYVKTLPTPGGRREAAPERALVEVTGGSAVGCVGPQGGLP